MRRRNLSPFTNESFGHFKPEKLTEKFLQVTVRYRSQGRNYNTIRAGNWHNYLFHLKSCDCKKFLSSNCQSICRKNPILFFTLIINFWILEIYIFNM